LAEPFLGEIRVFSFGYPPRNWAGCDGQLLSIAQNNGLFSLLGTTYGGNGQNTFALPDLRSRLPLHSGTGFPLGAAGGAESVTLTPGEIPPHTHPLWATTDAATSDSPDGLTFAVATSRSVYGGGSSPVPMGGTVSTGGNLPHENRMPSVAVNFCIALQGIFPS